MHAHITKLHGHITKNALMMTDNPPINDKDLLRC